MKDLVKVYKSLDRSQADYNSNAVKIQKILMMLLEFAQLDIVLHVLHEDVFFDVLLILEDMHREKFPDVNYRNYFLNDTRYTNFFNFPPQVIASIQLRYKIMFLKDYVFCDHTKEDFLNYLNSVCSRCAYCRSLRFQTRAYFCFLLRTTVSLHIC